MTAVKDTDAPHCPRLPYAMLLVLMIACTDSAQVCHAIGKQRIQDGVGYFSFNTTRLAVHVNTAVEKEGGI